MGDLNSSTNILPWNVSVISFNETDGLRSNIAPPWVSTPNIRGTMDILQSCILTLVACIYTALHLDVLSEPTWKRFLTKKGKWVMITLLAPEISLYTAASQLYYAWSLKSALRKIQKEKQSSNWTADADFEITLKYAFFVVMGAVRFDVQEIMSIEDLDKDMWKLYKDSEEHQRSVRPGPAAIISLADKGHWIKIRTEDIDDKSKANTVQKVLVMIQVLWMVIQCASRTLFGLPLSLLEMHTMVHVVCAVLLYACWFKKPLDIQEPIIIQPHRFISELSIMLQRQFYREMSYKLAMFPEKHQPDQLPPTDVKGEPMRWIEPEPGVEMKIGDILPSGLAFYRADLNRERNPLPNSKDFPETCIDYSFELTTEFLRRWDAILLAFPDNEREGLAETSKKLGILKTVSDGEIVNDGEIVGPDPFDPGKQVLYLARLDEFQPNQMIGFERPFWEGRSICTIDLTPKVQNYSTFNALFWKYRWLTILAAALSAAYGGIHLTAWRWVFPSSAEGTIWKLSCFLIAGFVPGYYANLFLWMLHSRLLHLMGRWDPYEHFKMWRKMESYFNYYFSGFLVFLLIIGTALSRCFIIAEAFASLRYCPVGVFLTFEWMEVLPHF